MKHVLDWLSLIICPNGSAHNPVDALPDFQNFAYQIAIMPEGSHIGAWAKLREAERRLAMYKWVEQHNDPANPKYRILMNDSVGAFLLTFEAAIQFLKDQLTSSGTTLKFDNWFARQPQNDCSIKGLRTLRHIEAHVEGKPIPRHVYLDIHSSLGGGKKEIKMTGCFWQLPKLQQTDLAKLRNPPLAVKDLCDWNNLVKMQDAKTVLADSILKLKDILESAEAIILNRGA